MRRLMSKCIFNTASIVILFQFKKYTEEMAKCEEVILLNAKTCLQQSELYPAQLLHKQFVELYLEQNDYLSGKNK